MLRQPWRPPRDWQESSSVKLYGAQKSCVMKNTCDIQVKYLEQSYQQTHLVLFASKKLEEKEKQSFSVVIDFWITLD